jgi:hypothetical protein
VIRIFTSTNVTKNSRKVFEMNTIKMALFSAVVAVAPAAYAQPVSEPVETEQPAPDAAPESAASDVTAPETIETEEAKPEVSNAPAAPAAPEAPQPNETASEPMAR